VIGYEQTCQDCGTHEAAGAYCTKCFGRNLSIYKTGAGRPRSAAKPRKTGGKPGRPRKESAEVVPA
jgi:hypothetical protein